MKHHILLATSAIAALTLAAGAADAAAAAATQNATTIGELVVTAERRQENLQETPVAVSAFSQQTLQARGVSGGQDLLLQIPNVNYSRGNFGGFNLKIRGIGVDVVAFSGTTGVSINENELPIAGNNFANTDFYDVQRVEVVRGPQGTLYGRNATGGAADIITNLPTKDFGGYATVGYGNYNTIKASGAVNIPLGDDWALRIAGFRLMSDGFGENEYLHQRVDGRDLGSIRATLRFHPSDRLDAWLMWEHYAEDDDRNRIGKQLCIKDPGATHVGPVPIAPAGGPIFSNYQAFLTQGCQQGSLYQPAAYGTLNSNATAVTLDNFLGINNGQDLFRDNPLQSTNLHNIMSVRQPLFTSYQDLVMLHVAYKLSDDLTLTSITGFNRTWGASEEDYNRIVPVDPFMPVANGLLAATAPPLAGLPLLLFPNGLVNDPQIGPSNKTATFDYGTASAKEYTEEVRLASSYSGPINFTVGASYSEITEPFGAENYYVFSNALTAPVIMNNVLHGAVFGPIFLSGEKVPNGQGHQYYDARSGGGFLKTYAINGEVYWQITHDLRLTLGGRYNVDQLYNNSFPIELYVPTPNGQTPTAGADGTVAYPGFPPTVCTNSLTECVFPQKVTYRKFTGRANLDWTPHLSFTDSTLFYVSYARGYKGGGFNTPCQTAIGQGGNIGTGCPYPLSYAPEAIDAYEIGTKNTLMGGKLLLDLDAFYYNYTGYQISTIVAKSSVNLNINSKIYGVEFEGVFSPIDNLTLNANVGYLHTRIDDGQSLVDQMNLTQGNPAYTRLHGLDGTACLAPTSYLAALIANGFPAPFLTAGTPAAPTVPGACTAGGYAAANALFNAGVDFNNVNGIPQNIGGNQMPNSPHWTVNAGAQYVINMDSNWKLTPRVDFYWQDSSFARVFNAVNDFLQPYHVVNASITLASQPMGLEVQLWAKNLFNAQPITGVYLTNDTSGLFQNVFTLDPRTYGVSVTKRW
jgi:outer membrane receptor protein involved in Fe transport